MKITYRIEVEQDDTAVRGNAMASGDPAMDKEAEDCIFLRLDAGEVWAWAAVTVIAEVTYDFGAVVTGEDHLGCCSYRDEDEFKADAYYQDMCMNTLAAALEKAQQLQAALARKSLFDDEFKYTAEAQEVAYAFDDAISAVFKKYTEAGYSPRELAVIANMSLTVTESLFVMNFKKKV